MRDKNMNKKQENINTYNSSAESLKDKFDSLGGYPNEIKKVFSLVSKNNPKVFEIGCGSGRDAQEILKYTNDYLGIDFSGKLIEYAKKNNPKANFLVADADDFVFPSNNDIIFAFASLLHSDKKSISKILKKIHSSLNTGKIVFLSLKYGAYQEKIKIDEFGKRIFYYYDFKTLKELTKNNFKIIWKEIENYNGQRWINIILQKVD